ncbi:hypothetical protein FM107_15080 [Sphingobacterium sp. JB170]|nr:hypothetical protein FM107_15080 [Sphingobacterium sp. JB170]
MFFSIRQNQIATHKTEGLENPNKTGNAMELVLFRTEGRSFFHTSHTKQAFGEYWDVVQGKEIPKRLWTTEMKANCTTKVKEAPSPPFFFKVTIVGWLFLLLAFGIIGSLVYEGIQAPKQAEKYQQELTEKARISEGDVYFGNYRVYKEKGNVIGSEGGFGWFKVVKIEDSTYHISKSVETSDVAKPKEEVNSTDFEQETNAVKAKELGAHHKSFVSEDGLVEFSFSEKKNK